jgi:hypothetical protein
MQVRSLAPLAGLAGLGVGYLLFKRIIEPRYPKTETLFGVPKRTVVSCIAGGVVMYVGSGMEGLPMYATVGIGGGILLGEALSWGGGA